MSKKVLLAITLIISGLSSAQSPDQRMEGNLRLSDVPPVDLRDKELLRPYLEARTGTSFGWLPHGDGLLIGTRFGDTQQLHKISQPLGARTQLSFDAEPVLSAVVNFNIRSPAAIYARDTGGDEQYQFYLYDFLSQQTQLLTEGPSTRNESAVFAPDGFQFAYSRTNAEGGYQIRIGDIRKPGKSEVVFSAKDAWYVTDIAPDGNRVLLQNRRSILDATLIELNLKTAAKKVIGPDKGASLGQAQYSIDGKSVYFLSDLGGQFTQLHRYQFKDKKITQIGTPILRDVEEFSFNADETMVALNLNFDGNSELQILQLKDGALLAKSAARPGVIRGIQFHPRENWVSMSLSGGQTPGDVFVFDVINQKMTRWSSHELGGLRAQDLVLPSLIDFVGGADETAYRVEAWLYKPTSPGPHPVLVIVHGGPESQSRPGFDAWAQFLVRELGIAVVLPNVRGSSGYGRTFLQMDDGVKRVDSVDDLRGLLDWVKQDASLDSKRVAIMGGSYGGFMTLAGLASYSKDFVAGISIVGISDLGSFLRNTSNYRRDLRRAEYGDERDPKIQAAFAAVSPLLRAKQITVPLFVIQGANDPRVPASEADQIVSAVRANGKSVWAMTAQDEGHGFRKKANVDRMRLAITAFLRKHLLSPTP